MPTLIGKTFEEVFDGKGKLFFEGIGASTVWSQRGMRYNAVIYSGISEETLTAIDRIEGESNLERFSLGQKGITTFKDDKAWHHADAEVFFYAAFDFVEIGGQRIDLINGDVNPNPDYLATCRNAAWKHGKAFWEAYQDTTFLADRKTPLRCIRGL